MSSSIRWLATKAAGATGDAEAGPLCAIYSRETCFVIDFLFLWEKIHPRPPLVTLLIYLATFEVRFLFIEFIDFAVRIVVFLAIQA